METSFISTLANSRLAFGILTAGGMAMCMPGIGKVIRLGLWLHPVAFAGYLLGAFALLLGAQGLFRLHLLPFTNAQALLAILGIIVVKIVLATLLRA